MSLFKQLFIVLVICMIVPGLVFSDVQEKPKVKKGAGSMIVSGSLVQWKSIEKVDFHKQPNKRKGKPIMNFQNPKKIVKQTGDDKRDPVAQTTMGKESKDLEKGALGMTAGIDFAGMNYSANGAGWPPDTNGDVGPTYFIQTVNTSIGIYNKSTGALVSATTFDSFFPSSVGSPCDSNNNGDPIVLYDRYNQRWFILDFAWSGTANGSYYSIAASQTSDPTGSWWTYCLHADNTLMNDYPKCGVWHDGIYITANMFQFSGSYQHAKVWALKTPDLYSGTMTVQYVTDSGTQAFSLMPCSAKSPTAPSSSSPNFFYAMDADEFGGGAQDALYVWKYSVDWTNSANTTWTGPSQMLTAAFGLVASGVPQSGTSNTLDSLYGRLMYPANYWNFGTYESVVLSHVCEYSSRRAMRWYEIRIDSSDNSSIYQQGTYSPDSNHRWMGAAAINSNGDIALGYSISSSSMYPSIRYAGRNSSDTLGTLAQGEATMVTGSGYQSSYSRWGDYSSCFVDPSDNETFWYTQEYYTSSGTNWQTRIGSFTVGGSTPPPCTLEEAVDNASITLTSSDWACDETVYCNDSDAAKSGTITHNQSSSMEFTRTFSGTECVEFQWRVSSESGYDYLRVYVDDVDQGGGISGEVACTTKSIGPLSAGSHTIRWTYSKDGSVSNGSDAGWVDQVQIVTCGGGGCSDTIAVVLDDDECNTYSNTGDELWTSTTSDYHYGSSSMTVPAALSDSESCTIQTTISGYCTISFWWKVSSESSYDYLNFYIDGVRQDRISGTVAWQQKTYTVSSGSHTIKWVYSKDGSVSSGSDAGWVDDVVFSTTGCGSLTYCDSEGNNQNYEWISQVQVADINKSSGASGYSDFTGTTGHLTRGSSASVTLTPDFASSSYTEYWKIWIDYNQDGDFTDSGEEVFSSSGSSSVSGSFTPPTSALTGDTRMRVTMKYGSAPSSCETFTYGEVEDYTVNIQ